MDAGLALQYVVVGLAVLASVGEPLPTSRTASPPFIDRHVPGMRLRTT